MNFVERKNIRYRLISCFLILISLGLVAFSLATIIKGQSEDKILSIIACVLTACFALFEFTLVIKGWKKPLSLHRIAFNDNGVVNNVFLVAVIIGTLFALGLTITPIVLYVTKPYEPFISASLVILSIAIYLLINCIIYFLYLIMYRKKELDLRDYSK